MEVQQLKTTKEYQKMLVRNEVSSRIPFCQQCKKNCANYHKIKHTTCTHLCQEEIKTMKHFIATRLGSEALTEMQNSLATPIATAPPTPPTQWEEQVRLYKEENVAAQKSLVVMAERLELQERVNNELLTKKQNDEVKTEPEPDPTLKFTQQLPKLWS